MIEGIKIAGCASYSVEGQWLTELRKINFIYGANGSGKTSISRVIADPANHPTSTIRWANERPLECLVYNTDFMERNFRSNLPGIFTLGEHDAAVLDQIDQTRKKIAEIEHDISARDIVLRGNDGASGKLGDRSALRENIVNECWKLKNRYDADFQSAFTGVRGSRARFCDEILSQWASNRATLHPLDDLKKRAAVIFEKGIARESTIRVPDGVELTRLEALPILVKKVVGQGDVDIAGLIDRLGNSDWVKQGIDYFGKSTPKCPFCQQDVHADLAKHIGDYFDDAYDRDIADIARLVTSYEAASVAYLQALNQISQARSRYLEADQLADLVERVTARLALNQQHIARKQKEPSAVVTVEDNTDLFAEVRAFLMAANAAINAHNRAVDDIGNQKTLLTSEIWKYLLEEAKSVLNTYHSSKTAVDAAINGIEASLITKRGDLATARQTLRDLEKGITSVQPTVTEVNALLASFGFRGFKLATAGDQGNLYEIVRLDGSNAVRSLSEGEKTFVTFLYFYHLIRGSVSESGMTSNRVIVFDDPISSLDSDILFIVSSLIKRVFELCRTKNSMIRQVFVLTHNIYFHKEVSFDPERKRERRTHETFWIVKKIDDISTLETFDHNPIKTSYELLWSEVCNENRSSLTIQNTLRRILENYFKILGNMDKDKIIEKFEGREKVICASLFSWVNDGSHSTHDDLYVSTDAATVDAYLGVFKRIFEETGHTQHYHMMMGTELVPIASVSPIETASPVANSGQDAG
ncbi:AAA family ATPase [Asaia sp. As-1742]|uniref:AAA family ATPase n=1 Tax=Asaia sp. As-1742 TaxID=2608325 RepID=UPI00141FDB90|nr:AAA family ATPase [Asaia sp. As-1742]NIE81703.1 AAA family ATPase [Asaia sp. As-1742]